MIWATSGVKLGLIQNGTQKSGQFKSCKIREVQPGNIFKVGWCHDEKRKLGSLQTPKHCVADSAPLLGTDGKGKGSYFQTDPSLTRGLEIKARRLLVLPDVGDHACRMGQGLGVGCWMGFGEAAGLQQVSKTPGPIPCHSMASSSVQSGCSEIYVLTLLWLYVSQSVSILYPFLPSPTISDTCC